MYDAGVASEAFCLAAYEQGLGTVIMGLFDQEEASKALNVPEDRELVALIPIGYPAESPTAPKKEDRGGFINISGIMKGRRVFSSIFLRHR